jgi:hypothetical protein
VAGAAAVTVVVNTHSAATHNRSEKKCIDLRKQSADDATGYDFTTLWEASHSLDRSVMKADWGGALQQKCCRTPLPGDIG